MGIITFFNQLLSDFLTILGATIASLFAWNPASFL
jgi:hypothetical protein